MPLIITTINRPQSRIVQLDVLRGIAILLVLGNHQVMNVRPNSQPFIFVFELSQRIGWTGVDLFFILSGFLIGSLLFNELRTENDIDVKRFLARRGLKIWPAYYIYMCFVFLVQYANIPVAIDVTGFPVRNSGWSVLKGVASNILNVQNYFPTLRGHTWSLAVEEHFYVLLPLLLVVVGRRSGSSNGLLKPIPALALMPALLLIACNLMRFRLAGKPMMSYFGTHLRIDELFAGVTLAYLNCLTPWFTLAVKRHRSAILAIGFSLIVFMSFLVLNDSLYTVPMVILVSTFAYSAILMGFVTTPLGEGWLGKALDSRVARLIAFLGTYSYSIYLWHYDLVRGPLTWIYKTGGFGELNTTKTWIICALVYIYCAVALGVVMSRLIEFPVLRLRDRLYPRFEPVITDEEVGHAEYVVTRRGWPDDVPARGGALADFGPTKKSRGR